MVLEKEKSTEVLIWMESGFSATAIQYANPEEFQVIFTIFFGKTIVFAYK